MDPEASPFANSCQLRRLVVSVSHCWQVLVSLCKPNSCSQIEQDSFLKVLIIQQCWLLGQPVNTACHFRQKDLETITDNDEVGIVSDKARGRTKVYDSPVIDQSYNSAYITIFQFCTLLWEKRYQKHAREP